MTKGKPWPKSDSEYIISDDQFNNCLSASHSRMVFVADAASHIIRQHAIAQTALIDLLAVAERYYEAAGFRQ